MCIWGIAQTSDILNPATVLADKDDVRAVEWVSEHTPADARFFLNTTPWQGQVYRGTDGGWWILPLTGRQTLPPPVVYTWGAPDYVKQMTGLAEQASKISACGPEFWSIVREAHLDYAYLHAGLGKLSPAALQNCPGAGLAYQSGDVSIFHLTPPGS